MLLGMLYHRKSPERLARAYAYACVARSEGVDFFYFTPAKIDFDNRIIHGFRYERGAWREDRFRFPDVVYNAGRFRSEKSMERVNLLRSYVPFTSHSVGNKWILYEKLKKAGTFSSFLLPSLRVTDPSDALGFLRNFPAVILKPTNGHLGHGITLVERAGSGFRLATDRTERRLVESELHNWLGTRIVNGRSPYLAQPYVCRRNASGQPYDFRVHVQKNGKGRWTVASVYPRVAPAGCITTNLGYTTYAGPFLEQEFKEEAYNIMQYLKQFGLQLATHMDELYQVSFDELGIDLILDEQNKIWLLEANWRPGFAPSYELELNVVRGTLHYARYLLRQNVDTPTPQTRNRISSLASTVNR